MIEAREAEAPAAPRSFWASLADPLRGVDPKAAIAVAFATGCYVASHFEASGDFYGMHLAGRLHFGRFQDMAGNLYWLASSNVLFGVLPVLLLLAMREPLAEYGLGLGDRKVGFGVAGLFLAVMLPLIAFAAHTSAFKGAYPLDVNAHENWAHFWLFEALYVGYFAGWEAFHRGFLLFSLHRRIGGLAIFIQAMSFALLHFGKPEPEAWGSFVAGVALGVLAVRARSCWYGFFLHGAVAFFMDLVQSWPFLHHPR
ncbi:MAG: CPBP family glutamic-type intramembrane protease [Myxococcales bacterium]